MLFLGKVESIFFRATCALKFLGIINWGVTSNLDIAEIRIPMPKRDQEDEQTILVSP